MCEIQTLYDLNHTVAGEYLMQFRYPWEALQGIGDMILRLGAGLDPAEYTQVSEQVWIHRTAKVAHTAY